MNNAEKMYGLQNLQLYLKVRIFMDRQSSERMQKYVTVHLFVEMQLLEKVLL